MCLPVRTMYRHYVSLPGRSLHAWNEWLRLPLKYSSLPRLVVVRCNQLQPLQIRCNIRRFNARRLCLL